VGYVGAGLRCNERLVRYYSVERLRTVYPAVLGLLSYARAISSCQPKVNVRSASPYSSTHVLFVSERSRGPNMRVWPESLKSQK
jgi:hypothetical protein